MLQALPIVIGMARGVLSLEKAADHIMARRARLPGRLTAAVAAVAVAPSLNATVVPMRSYSAAAARAVDTTALVVTGSTSSTATIDDDDGGAWTLVCRGASRASAKSKQASLQAPLSHGYAARATYSAAGVRAQAAREREQALTLRDAVLLQDLAYDSGLVGTNPAAFVKFLVYCRRVDRFGRQTTLSVPAPLDEMGFALASVGERRLDSLLRGYERSKPAAA